MSTLIIDGILIKNSVSIDQKTLVTPRRDKQKLIHSHTSIMKQKENLNLHEVTGFEVQDDQIDVTSTNEDAAQNNDGVKQDQREYAVNFIVHFSGEGEGIFHVDLWYRHSPAKYATKLLKNLPLFIFQQLSKAKENKHKWAGGQLSTSEKRPWTTSKMTLAQMMDKFDNYLRTRKILHQSMCEVWHDVKLLQDKSLDICTARS